MVQNKDVPNPIKKQVYPNFSCRRLDGQTTMCQTLYKSKSKEHANQKKTELFDILSVKMRKLSRDIIFVHEGHQLESEGLRQ